ncbi:VIT and vWA domain-containing protein [Pseudemcibacter aquimaris]|uniref:VIT and vWA domain-containing protein n=1 Tax=Pseudemcibacter aquimaris TaxID=2857064 RepID=UPI002012E4D8|nr:VIT and VWA domain-containing protein [Pseudemcibacter aquimaris]MCC3859785.1 VIT and VWA domain-containing protein [Pseudemcibacter aquimaris]WDU60179.1 VIT and VWA domain-containing protein [Pseudemcibacter aquimaris]
MNRILYLVITFCFINITLSSSHAADIKMGGTIEAEMNGKLTYLPQLKTDIVTDISGDLASVEITQSFANPHSVPMNARYLFPMNKDAAVYQMTMLIGDEITRAIIKRKEEAIRTFERAKSEGKTASLLSQHRPNMFTQKIANLMPGKTVHIKIKYTQVVPEIDGSYELVLPLVVGPRYQPANAGEAPISLDDGVNIRQKSTSRSPFGRWELEELPKYPGVTGLTLPNEIDQERVSIKVNLAADLNIQNISSDTHDIEISGTTKNRNVKLRKDRIIDNSDFVLKYQLAGALTDAGFLSTMNETGDGYFSLLIEPPKTPTADQISNREMVFVIDTSGSMGGAPIEASKTFMRHALRNLRQGDYFRIIIFNSSATEFSSTPLLATKENIEKGLYFVDHLYGSGGTEIASSITQAFGVPPKDGAIRLVTMLTDGYIGNEAQILNMIAANIGEARIFAMGVGTGVNRYLLSEMGRKGRGFARFIDPTEDVEDAAIALSKRLNAPVLTDISLDFGNMEVSDITPDVIPDLFAGDSIRIQGKYKGTGNKTIRINGKSRGNKASLPLNVNLASDAVEGRESIPIIWARSQVADRMRHINVPARLRNTHKSVQQLKKEVVDLGLTHSLVTKWTSFVAVSEKIRNPNPNANIDGDVPLPMVKGISDKAYGDVKKQSPAELLEMAAAAPVAQRFSGSSAPEPGIMGGMAILGMVGIYMIRRKRKEK